MTKQVVETPRIFISYSWSSEEHTQWVADLGERLMSDGIDVVLDQWSLKDGQDLNVFMEQMVTDPSIKRVIIVCDARYAQKADTRKSGVGTESQIISPEIYQKVDQHKFIPLVRERNSDGLPCLRVFLKSRKYIDFSNPDIEAQAYEQLIRNIYERPVRQKPALGTAPTELFDDTSIRVPAAQKCKRFRETVATGKGNPSIAFGDFVDEFVNDLEDLRLSYSHEQKETWCQTMMDNIARSKFHRNAYIDAVHCGVMHIRDDWFIQSLFSMLERLLPFQERPKRMGAFVECSEDNYKFLVWELFLYSAASLFKSGRYTDLRQLLVREYLAAETLDSQRLESHEFLRFEAHPKSLEGECAQKSNRMSLMADLLHERADRSDIKFSDLAQADVICCIAAVRNRLAWGWYPKSLIYSRDLGKLEGFARATTEEGFLPFKQILGFSTPQEMIQFICSDKMLKIWNGRDMIRSVYIEELFNLDVLRKKWAIQEE